MTLSRSFQVDRSSDTPLTEQISRHYHNAIRSGGILFGTRLPSIRELSAHLGVNKISVIGAYERLVDAGLIVSKLGSGFYVSHRRSARVGALEGIESMSDSAANGPETWTGAAPLPHCEERRAGRDSATMSGGTSTRQLTNRALGVPSVPHANQSYPLGSPSAAKALTSAWHTAPGVIPLGASHIPSEQQVLDELRSVTRHVLLDSEKVNLAYEHPQGNLELRERLAADLELRGVPVAGGEQVLVTSGALQALNLALDVLCRPGDAVAAEVPAFTLLFPLLAHRGLRLVEMPRGFEGFLIDAQTEQRIKRERPKVVIVSPNFHNPLGGLLSAHQRHEVVRLATDMGATLIEMDVFGGLHFGEIVQPSLASLDGLQRTLYVSSFSKSLSPGLRLGYVCGSPSLVARMTQKKTLLDVSTSSLDQALLTTFMARGFMRKHLARARETYRSRRNTLTAILRKLAPQGSRWTTPEGGIFLWFEFPPGPSPTDIEAVALEKRVAIAPGSLFLPDHRETRGMRLNFAAMEPVHTYRALETVFALWRAAGSRRWASGPKPASATQAIPSAPTAQAVPSAQTVPSAPTHHAGPSEDLGTWDSP